MARGIANLGSYQEAGLSREGFYSMADRELFTQALARVKNRFLFTNVLAERIAQLRKGSEPLVEIENADHEAIALTEIIDGKLKWELGEPIAPEGAKKKAKGGKTKSAQEK